MQRMIAAVLLAMMLAGPAVAEDLKKAYRDKEHAVRVEPLLTPPVKSVVGEDIFYPGGAAAEISAAVIELPTGQATPWHRHGVPLFAYILSGELQVDYGDKGVRTFGPGQAFMEAMNHSHRGINRGKEPVRLIAVYMGARTMKNVIAE